jgi:hypothetical protein
MSRSRISMPRGSEIVCGSFCSMSTWRGGMAVVVAHHDLALGDRRAPTGTCRMSGALAAFAAGRAA